MKKERVFDIFIGVIIGAVLVGIIGDIFIVRQKTVQPEEVAPSEPREPASSEVAQRLAELGWHEADALAVAERGRVSTVCLMQSPEDIKNDRCGPPGFFAADGLIVTCGHCAHGHDKEGDETKTLAVKTLDGTIIPAEVLEIVDEADLGILKITSGEFSQPPPLSIGVALPGDPILVIGNPRTVGTWVPVLGAVHVVESWEEMRYEIDARTMGGNSGSPVLNKNGEVIGVVGGSSIPQDFPSPYPLELVVNLEEILPTNGYVRSGVIMADLINRHLSKTTQPITIQKPVQQKQEAQPKPSTKIRTSASEYLQKRGWDETKALVVAKKVRASTVCIASNKKELEQGRCDATGAIVSGGLVATCGHCIGAHHKGEEQIMNWFLKTIDGNIFSAEFLEIHATKDVGILRVTSNRNHLPPPLTMGYALRGDPVIAVGHPLATWVVTLGEVTDVIPVKEIPGDTKYAATLPTRPGSSGSPAVNRNGEIIGVISGSMYGDVPNPFPLEIILNLEEAGKVVATIGPRNILADMIERHQ